MTRKRGHKKERNYGWKQVSARREGRKGISMRLQGATPIQSSTISLSGYPLILFPCFASICALCISDDAPIYAPNKRAVSHPLFSSMFDVGAVRG